MKQIDDICSTGCKYGDASINYIIAFLVDQKKHADHGNQLKDDGTDSDVCILLQSLIQPLHADGGKEDCGTDDDIKRSVLLQLRHKQDRQQKHEVRHRADNEIQHQKLMRRARQFFFVVPHHSADAYAVNWDAELCKHVEIGD